MTRYLKLVNFELNRFVKIYVVLIAITILSQIIGVIVKSKKYLNLANEVIYRDLVPKEQFINDYGTMSLAGFTESIWFLGPIALSIAALIFYVFLIWYRDWFGKNTFIYRLLMLPTARLNVYLAKATTIFLMVLGLISLQLVLLPVESKVLQWMVPLDFRTDLAVGEILQYSYYMTTLFPSSFIEFVLYYGVGFMSVFILFTAILFERSFRLKGIILGVLYNIVTVVVFISPLLAQEFIFNNYFYPGELLLIEIVMGLLLTAGSIWLSDFLLKKKIRV